MKQLPIAISGIVAALTAFGYVLASPLGLGGRPQTRPTVEDRALNTLSLQLLRRFHDQTNVDFGISRVIKPHWRIHVAPEMGRAMSSSTKEFRTSNHETEMLIDGKWIPAARVRRQMMPENIHEREALATLRRSNLEVAIYTTSAPTHGISQRLRGPAYIQQDGPTAPSVDEIAPVAQQAWVRNPNVVAGNDGWRYRVVPVTATDATCTECHNLQQAKFAIPNRARVKGSRPRDFKTGDVLGLILIGTRPKAKA